MDLILYLIIALAFCYSTQKETVQEVRLKKRLNPDFYHDEDAFMKLYNRIMKG